MEDRTTTALLAAVGIAVLGVGGVLHEVALPDVRWLDLDLERTPAALWSALLLAAAAVAWLRLVRGNKLPRTCATTAALLALMAVDEWAEVHEELGGYVGTEWQLLYAPLVLVAGVGALVALRAWGWSAPSGFLVAGGACWVIAQGIEALEWWGDTGGPRLTDHYVWYLAGEELLEMAGSLMLLLAALPRSFRLAAEPAPVPA